MLPENEEDPLLDPEQSNNINTSASNRLTRFFENEIYRKFIFIIFWFLFTGYMVGITSAIADNRAIALYDAEHDSLGDIGIDFVHLFMNASNISPKSDAFCVYTLLCSFFLFILCLRICHLKTTKQAIIILIEWSIYINILFTLRYLNLCLTSFPSPSQQIVWQKCTKWDNIWIAPFLIISFQRSACHDFCFSGHTIVALICALMITKYSIILNDAPSWRIITNYHWRILRVIFVAISWIIVFLTILFLLTLELHYSIDITVALMLTIAIWKIGEANIKYKYGFFAWWIYSNDKPYNDYNRIE